jgi:hypothetical protein
VVDNSTVVLVAGDSVASSQPETVVEIKLNPQVKPPRAKVPGMKPNNSSSRHATTLPTTTTTAVASPTTATTSTTGPFLDEVYYFSQYVNNLEDSYAKMQLLSSLKKKITIPTDEVCFLCKDGGDLIECDSCIKGKCGVRCLKVYHSYCLDFQVEDDVEWLCPRHFCSCCGSKSLKYMCMFCPISICADCPQLLVTRVRFLFCFELNSWLISTFVLPLLCCC